MKIGFDVSQTGHAKAGCGYFADSLVQALADVDGENDYILYPTFGDAYWDSGWAATTRVVDRPNFRRGLGHSTFSGAQSFWRNPPVNVEQQLGQPDVIHANNFFCPVGLRSARLVYTLYDLSFLEHPEWTTEANRVACFSGTFNASLYAAHIVTISEYSRRNFLETFPHYPAEWISVIYPGSRFEGAGDVARPAQCQHLEPGRFWLNVGTVEPRKNHRRLLRAYARYRAQAENSIPLVLAGGKGWLMSEFEQLLDDLSLRQHVFILGYMDDTALQWLYQNCFAFVYPSLFEGFGLPVLEAMSLGAAVVASRATSLPEVVGDAGELIDPLDEDDLLRAMILLSTNESYLMLLKNAARARARMFEWNRTALRVLDVYAHALRKTEAVS